MKLLLVNASPHKKGSTARALDECRAKLKELGAVTEYYHLGNAARNSCTVCGGCKGSGTCVFGDIDALADAFTRADGIIIGVPTHYAGAPGNILSALSRLLFSRRQCVEYKPIAVIGSGRRGCITGAIGDVQKFFEFASCPIISGVYPALIYGSDYESAGFDAEGLQNMRSVAENMYWILSALELAEKNGISHPISEPKIKTDLPSLL